METVDKLEAMVSCFFRQTFPSNVFTCKVTDPSIC